jgi:hypothetical protein
LSFGTEHCFGLVFDITKTSHQQRAFRLFTLARINHHSRNFYSPPVSDRGDGTSIRNVIVKLLKHQKYQETVYFLDDESHNGTSSHIMHQKFTAQSSTWCLQHFRAPEEEKNA